MQSIPHRDDGTVDWVRVGVRGGWDRRPLVICEKTSGNTKKSTQKYKIVYATYQVGIIIVVMFASVSGRISSYPHFLIETPKEVGTSWTLGPLLLRFGHDPCSVSREASLLTFCPRAWIRRISGFPHHPPGVPASPIPVTGLTLRT